MLILQGKGVFAGVTLGPVQIYRPRTANTKRRPIANISTELERFHVAQKKAQAELALLGQKALAESGAETGL